MFWGINKYWAYLGCFILYSFTSTANPVSISAPQFLSNDLPGDHESFDAEPFIESSEDGTWIAVWRSIGPYSNGASELEHYILFSRSIDQGTTWSDPAPLNHNASKSLQSNIGYPNLATDNEGHWVCVWDDPENPPYFNPNILTSYSTDNGITWSPPIHIEADNDGDLLGLPKTPQIVTDKEGNWICIWTNPTTPGNPFYIAYALSTDNGATWSEKNNLTDPSDKINDAPVHNYNPHLRISSDGTWILAWESNWGSENNILVSRSQDSGENWSDPIQVHSSPTAQDPYAHHLKVDTDNNKNWIVIWQSEHTLDDTIGADLDILYSRSPDNGETWSTPKPINSAATSDTAVDTLPEIKATSNNYWTAIWESYTTPSPNLAILQSVSDDSGSTWSAPKTINTLPLVDPDFSYTYESNLISNGQGDIIISWSGGNLEDTLLGPDREIFRTQSADNGLTWTSPSPLNTNAPLDVGIEYRHRLGRNLLGHPVVSWITADFLGTNEAINRENVFSTSPTQGLTWTDQSLLDDDAKEAIGPGWNALSTTDGAGTWLTIYNTNSYAGTDYDIIFIRSEDDGENWTEPSHLNTDAETDISNVDNDTNPDTATDGQGTWITVWEKRLPNQDNDVIIVSARSTDNGATWDDPLAIDNTPNIEGRQLAYNPSIATDGEGIWVVAYNGDNQNLILSRSFDDGITWSDPLQLSSTENWQYPFVPQIAADGYGNWIVTWNSPDSLEGTIGEDVDILFSYSSDNAQTWSTPNPLNTNAANDAGQDYSPQLLNNGEHQWLVTWESTDGLGTPSVGLDSDIVFANISTDSTISTQSLSSGGGGCFIATAAYGTPMATEIDTLRTFRNEYLLTNTIGSAFVDTYYRLSPPIANVVAQHSAIATIIRIALTPLIWILQLPIEVLVLAISLLTLRRITRQRRAIS